METKRLDDFFKNNPFIKRWKDKIIRDCKKCDERGMIYINRKDGMSGHSCSCGKYHKLLEEKWKNVDIGDLLNYGRMRIKEKQQYD